MKPLAYQCGLPRSGSTVAWQLMRDILTDHDVRKVHPVGWEPDGNPIIATVRDPRDVVASLCRVRLSRDHRTELNAEDLDIECAWLYQQVEALMLLQPSAVLRYEEFWDWYDVIYDAIERVFGVNVKPFVRRGLSELYGVRANAIRAEALDDFNAVDEDGVHGAHIATPRPGSWRDSLPEWAHAPMLAATYPLCERLTYPCE